ncbi:MAG: hypothetical protein NVS9B10_24740 [Nevskia sp.]
MTDADKPRPSPAIKPPTLLDTIFSVLASFFGVQSEKNRRRDFTAGKPMVFIGVAIVLTVVFVFSLILVVKIMLANAGM